MKSHGHLFERIVSWPNLVSAARRAARGKPLTRERAAFEFNLENELVRLQRDLITGEYLPGEYKTFIIHDPKERIISAAPYRDRVIHHALCNVIEPLFDNSFLPQNYANRKGRGLHLAVKAGSRIVNACPFLLKADIRKYFPSIDHAILKETIRKKIRCRATITLVDRLIDGSNPQEPVLDYFLGDDLFAPIERKKGLPIGNLTSQLFANIYLDGLDHFIVHTLKHRRYARYVDDFLVGGLDKSELWEIRRAVEAFLAGFRLKMHRAKTVVFPARRGVTFLGFRLYPGRVLAGKRCGKRFKARLKTLQKQYAAGSIDLKEIKRVIASYNGHLAHGATEKLRAGILSEFPFARLSTDRMEPTGAGPGSDNKRTS